MHQASRSERNSLPALVSLHFCNSRGRRPLAGQRWRYSPHTTGFHVPRCNLLNVLIFFTPVSNALYSMLRLRTETRAEFTKEFLQPRRSKLPCSFHTELRVLTDEWQSWRGHLKNIIFNIYIYFKFFFVWIRKAFLEHTHIFSHL